MKTEAEQTIQREKHTEKKKEQENKQKTTKN